MNGSPLVPIAPILILSPGVLHETHASMQIGRDDSLCLMVALAVMHAVLSNGEQFRVDLARHLLEGAARAGPTVVDEFTSVVDRQVAQIASHAVAKYIRKRERQFVAVSCHYDIVDWLQPDWVLHLPDLRFERRLVQRRPSLTGRIERVPYSTWRLFAPFHYLTADLNRAARCYGMWIDGYDSSPVAFLGMLARPHPKVEGGYGISRIVTLPDWQGLGLGPFMMDTLAGVYRAVDRRVNAYPAHPSLTRSFSRSPKWKLVKKPGVWSAKVGKTNRTSSTPGLGGRPSATFQWVGPAYADAAHAQRIIDCPHVGSVTSARSLPVELPAHETPALRRMPRRKVFS